MPSSFGARHRNYGPEYDKFRTGLTFRDVQSMLWSAAAGDPSKWRYKRRGTVLGLWHQLKKEMWAEMERRVDEVANDNQQRKAG